jgi:ComF family protein
MAFALLDLIFPPRCVHCHVHLGHGQALCADCRRRVVLHRVFFCGKCRARRYSARGLCHRNFPFTLAAAGEYEDPIIQALIRSLKFHFVRDAAAPLGAILAAYAKRLKIPGAYDFILPVPLSRRRLRERGFNQSELIARVFARETGMPMDAEVLRRPRHAPPQSGIRGDVQRRANIAGSFEVARPEAVRGRNVILLDDVVTSGATMLTAALVLRAAGAKDILALAAAKA